MVALTSVQIWIPCAHRDALHLQRLSISKTKLRKLISGTLARTRKLGVGDFRCECTSSHKCKIGMGNTVHPAMSSISGAVNADAFASGNPALQIASLQRPRLGAGSRQRFSPHGFVALVAHDRLNMRRDAAPAMGAFAIASALVVLSSSLKASRQAMSPTGAGRPVHRPHLNASASRSFASSSRPVRVADGSGCSGWRTASERITPPACISTFAARRPHWRFS